MTHEIRPGQVYVACDPRDEGRRIRVEEVSESGQRARVVTLTDAGPTRRRDMWTRDLHASATTRTGRPRITGYALESATQDPQDAPQRPQERPAAPPRGDDLTVHLIGPQAADDGALLARLRDRLVAERDKAAASAAAPRPEGADGDVLRVLHDGMAAGLDIALRLLDHHVAERP